MSAIVTVTLILFAFSIVAMGIGFQQPLVGMYAGTILFIWLGFNTGNTLVFAVSMVVLISIVLVIAARVSGWVTGGESHA